jgi:hypothetical protein
MGPVLSGAASLLILGAVLWLPLLAALIWGKCDIPTAEVKRLLVRSAKISLGAGVPSMFAGLLFFAHLDPQRQPLPRLLEVSAVISIGCLPLYGALVTTNVFQDHHRASGAPRRHFVVRLLSGTVILAANLVAAMFFFFPMFAISGVYRGWR